MTMYMGVTQECINSDEETVTQYWLINALSQADTICFGFLLLARNNMMLDIVALQTVPCFQHGIMHLNNLKEKDNFNKNVFIENKKALLGLDLTSLFGEREW